MDRVIEAMCRLRCRRFCDDQDALGEALCRNCTEWVQYASEARADLAAALKEAKDQAFKSPRRTTRYHIVWDILEQVTKGKDETGG